MIDYRSFEQRVSQALGLTRRPVAVSFRDSAPAGVTNRRSFARLVVERL
jgi:hypothetical protein